MKRLFSIFILLAVSLVLVSCDDSTTLTTVSMFGGTDPNGEVYREIIDDFKKETGWKVKDTSTQANEEWKEKVRNDFVSGNEPDVLQFFTGEDAKAFVDAGKVVSIEEIRKEYPNYAKNINESLMGTHSVPTTGFVEGIFTNTTHFKSNESKAYLNKTNWTWDEFKDLLALLVDENDTEGYKPISMGQDIPHYWLDHMVLADLGEDFATVIKGTNGDQKLTETLLKLNEIKEYLSYESSEADASQGFKDGDYTFLLDGSWAAGGLVGSEVEEHVKVFPFPVVNEDVGTVLLSGYTSGFYITKKAWDNEDKRAKAVEFVEMMTSTTALTKYAKVGGFAADDNAVPADVHPINKELAALGGVSDFATLPFGDLSNPDGYKILTDNQGAYFSGNETDTLKFVKEFLKK